MALKGCPVDYRMWLRYVLKQIGPTTPSIVFAVQDEGLHVLLPPYMPAEDGWEIVCGIVGMLKLDSGTSAEAVKRLMLALYGTKVEDRVHWEVRR